MFSYETIKREIKDFIVAYDTSLTNKITSMFPQVDRFESPSVVIDIASATSEMMLDGAVHQIHVRLVFISDDLLELDETVDTFVSNYYTYRSEFTSFHPVGTLGGSQILKAFEEKNDIWRRDVIISGYVITKI